jgi:hypothetical protein
LRPTGGFRLPPPSRILYKKRGATKKGRKDKKRVHSLHFTFRKRPKNSEGADWGFTFCICSNASNLQVVHQHLELQLRRVLRPQPGESRQRARRQHRRESHTERQTSAVSIGGSRTQNIRRQHRRESHTERQTSASEGVTHRTSVPWMQRKPLGTHGHGPSNAPMGKTPQMRKTPLNAKDTIRSPVAAGHKAPQPARKATHTCAARGNGEPHAGLSSCQCAGCLPSFK